MNQPASSRRSAATAVAPDRGDVPGRGPRHLRVVDDPISRLRSGPLRLRLALAAAAIGAVVIAFALVYLHVVMAQRQFRLDSLSSQVSTQQATYSRLRLQVAELESPQRIIATAEGKLGMRQPASVTYLAPTTPLPAGGSAAGSSSMAGDPPSADGTVAAPAGDADWPQIKSQLAGSP